MDDLDHRNLGVKLKLWHIQEDAPGMVFWHPRGHAVYRVLEDYLRRKMRRAGYCEVRTPQLLPKALWDRSGHWEKFSEHMFRVVDGELAMALKPMSCPCHVQIFNKGLHSWRELPIRYAEFGACHRNEPSGSLHGIMRTRAFEQDDAHVFCREEDVEHEVRASSPCWGRSTESSGFPIADRRHALTPIGIQAQPAAQALRCSSTLRNSGLEQRKTHTVEGSRLHSKSGVKVPRRLTMKGEPAPSRPLQDGRLATATKNASFAPAR